MRWKNSTISPPSTTLRIHSRLYTISNITIQHYEPKVKPLPKKMWEDDEGEADSGETTALGEFPIYNPFSSNSEATVTSPKDGRECHCENADMWCYMCTFANGTCPDDSGIDTSLDIHKHIEKLIQLGHDTKTIAKDVYQKYNRYARPYVDYEDDRPGHEGEHVVSPEWTLRSIERHIAFSGHYKQLALDWKEKAYDSMLLLTSQNMVCADGTLCPKASDEWRKNMKGYTDFMKARAQLKKLEAN